MKPTIKELIAKAAPGPYFVSRTERSVDTFLAHKNGGLALVDTGREEDWPITYFSEWPQAEYTARLTPEVMSKVVEALTLAHLHSRNEALPTKAQLKASVETALALLNGGTP